MKKGFTLIEMLIVIGILAGLSTVVVLVISPIEKLREARDTQRLSDLRSLKDAINLYLARASSPTLNDPPGAAIYCDAANTGASHPWRATTNFPPSNPINLPLLAQPFFNPDSSQDSDSIQPSVIMKTDGSGWAAVPFTAVAGTGGSPIAKLPVDPVNKIINNNDLSGLMVTGSSGSLFYAYQCRGLTYEINANMESQKYSNGGSKDVESKDGGTSACYFQGAVTKTCAALVADQIYEIGTDPGLDL